MEQTAQQRNCVHELFEVDKWKHVDSNGDDGFVHYKKLMCAYCAHMRIISSDGKIELIENVK